MEQSKINNLHIIPSDILKNILFFKSQQKLEKNKQK